MSAEEYWHGDVEYPRAYRKAAEIRKLERNYDAWLQGMYFYEALGDVAPVFQAFAKKGTTARDYPHKPYDILPEKKKPKEKKQEKKAKEDKQMEMTKVYMQKIMAGINMKFAKKEVNQQKKGG